MAPNYVPPAAPEWQTGSDRARWLDVWRMAIMKKLPERAIKVAWVLEWMMRMGKGFAFVTDGTLAQKTGIPVKKVQAALLDLERGGAIVRVSVVIRDKAQRRIFPSTKILGGTSPTAGVSPIPPLAGKSTPHGGGTEYNRRETAFRGPRISATQDAARREAFLREAGAARRQATLDADPVGPDDDEGRQ